LPYLSGGSTEQASEEYREDLRARVPLSATSLPSVCFYTFLNAHGGLNAVALARDGSLAAGAFADSSVKFWDFNPDRVRKDARRYRCHVALLTSAGFVVRRCTVAVGCAC
jgi:transcription initiation factor TFIID subunit 5